jgi:hypothetical protein
MESGHNMPNHVTNSIIITGPVADVYALQALLQGETAFDFNRVLPMPHILEGTQAPCRDPELRALLIAETGCADWYEWCCHNWGTKWNAYNVSSSTAAEIEVLARTGAMYTIAYTFDTAWMPPTPVVCRIAELFPSVTIVHDYIDECPNFGGQATYESGVQVSNECSSTLDGIRGISDWLAEQLPLEE